MSWRPRRKGSGFFQADPIRRDSGKVVHEGWAVKESGTAMFGKTNWRKRWFRLVQRDHTHYLEYYRSTKDLIPAGYVKLDVTYCTRPVESSEKMNCFAVGPIFDDGATRTYYISCAKALEMREWMAVIDAVVQGAPEDAQRRRQTVNKFYAIRHKESLAKAKEKSSQVKQLQEQEQCTGGDDLTNSTELSMSMDSSGSPCPSPTVGGASHDSNSDCIGSLMISESLTRDDLDDDEMMDDIIDDEIDQSLEDQVGGVSIDGASVCGAGATPMSDTSTSTHRTTPDYHMTMDEKRAAYVNTAWRLQRWEEFCRFVTDAKWVKTDTKDGVSVSRCKFGRSSKGYAVIKVEGILPSDPRNVFNFLKLSTKQGGKLDYLFRNEFIVQEINDEPKASVIYNEFQPPLPQVSIRDVVAMKIWVPAAMSLSNNMGFIMFSVDHPDVNPPDKGYTRISVGSSGMILSVYPGPKNEVHTKLTIVGQVAFYGAMHKMLKGAYNSGLLKLGFRTTFSFISEQLERYLEITNI